MDEHGEGGQEREDDGKMANQVKQHCKEREG